ncbi:MAG TPA: hypothetical protein VFB87_04070 [Gaiellaceae bacterium]|nr:hypothetical protein [Gaiellaceae bacterium]
MARKTSARRKSRFGLILGAALAALALGTVARADDISNTLDPTVDAVAEIMPLNVGGPSGTTNLVVVARNGDGKNGCNLTGSTTLVVSISSSNSSVATVSPSSATFTSCSATPLLTVTPHNQGTATISVSQTSNNTGGTFNLAPATFTVNVAPPPNTPPQISVGGVTTGDSYAKGSVPAATCHVTDAEDGDSSFPATLSAISGAHASDGIGEQTASCSYTDAGGVTAAASKVYFIVDPSGPGITPVLAPPVPDGDNGWYRSDIALAWTVSEPQSPSSLVKTGCLDQSITTDQAETTYACSATSAGGGAGPVSVSLKRDATRPTIGGNASPAANAAGWNNTSVSVSFLCDDNLSGLASCGPDGSLTAQGADQSVSGTAVDNAGNSRSTTVAGIDIDLTNPTITGSRSPGANGAGWNNTDVTVSFSCADGLSGVASCPTDQTVSAEGANQSVAGTAFDVADNSASATVAGISIDKTNPSIGGSASPAPNAAGWNNEHVTVSYDCDDDRSGVASCGPDQTLTTDGENQLATGTATDNADNSDTATVGGIDIDQTDPTISGAIAPASATGSNGWYVNAPTVTFTCDDALSGIASCVADGTSPATHQVTLGESASAQSAGGTATDVADNAATASLGGVKVDLSDPTLQCGATPTFMAGQLGNVSASVADLVSGPVAATVSAPAANPNGGSVTLTGYDNAGRSASIDCPYHVIGATFLQPINGRPIVNVAKLGRVIPVKVQLVYDGAPRTDLNTPSGGVTIGVGTTPCTVSTTVDDIEAYAAGSSNSGLQFRWESLAGFWMYNLDTSSFAMKPSSCYQGSVYLNGTKAGFFFVKITK